MNKKKGTLLSEAELTRDAVKQTTEETQHLYDALISIGETLKITIEETIDGMKEGNDVGKAIANTYKKDIVGAVKSTARNLEKQVGFSLKIKEGINVEKQIQNEIRKTTERKLIVQEKLNSESGKALGLSDEQIGALLKEFDLDVASLKALKTRNTERQKEKGLIDLALGPLKKMADSIDKSGTLSKLMSGNFKDTITYARVGQATMASLGSFLIKAIIEIDKLQTGLNRQFGFTNSTAARIQQRFEGIAASSSHALLNFKDIHKASEAITAATGIFAGTLRGDVLDGAAKTLEFMGLSGDAVARLALNAQTTGQHFDDQTLSMADGLIIAEQTVGVTLDGNKAFQTAASLTGLIRANLGRNYQHIVETVGQAQALGLTMQDLEGISSNLLNFQSSIENELQAELFTGKQLNLEKARLFALTGDYKNLQKEIVGQAGSEYEFLSMNVLAKQKYAAALGMSVNQMSDLVMKNKDLSKIEDEARAANNQDVVDQMQALTLQQNFNKLIEKLQTSFVAMAPGIGAIADVLSTILSSSGAVYGLMLAIAGVKLGGVIAQIVAMVAAQTAAGTAAAWTLGLATAGIGLAIAIPLIMGATGMLDKNVQENAKAPKIGSFRNLPEGKMVTVDQGEARIHQGEFAGHISDFNAGFQSIVDAIFNQKLTAKVNVQSHHGTRYV